jgi:hypothetical protein
MRDFIGQPDEGKGDFLSKLMAQLASTSVDGVQAAAELLYVHGEPPASRRLASFGVNGLRPSFGHSSGTQQRPFATGTTQVVDAA